MDPTTRRPQPVAHFRAHPLALLVTWTVAVLAALWLLYAGLALTFHIENTGDALREAARGRGLVGLAMIVLLGAALLPTTGLAPRWAGIAVAVPAVLTGGWTLLDQETLLPFLSAVVTAPVGLAGVVGAWLAHRRAGRSDPAG